MESEDDAPSLLSGVESGADADSDEVPDDAHDDPPDYLGEELAEMPARAERGHYVLWNNGYFWASGYDVDAKIYICPRWTTAAELGGKFKSKTIQKELHGGLESTLFALRAWMLHRCQENEWHRRVPARLAWYRDEVRSLQRDVQGKVLRQETRDAIARWAPDVLNG